jgi:hypothetical protein
MSPKTAFLFWVWLAAVEVNPAVAFAGTSTCFNTPARVGQNKLISAKKTCISSVTTSANAAVYSYDPIAGRKRTLSSPYVMTMANAASESTRPAVEKPISQARFKETIQTIFEQIDMDGNGIIDTEEIQNLAGDVLFLNFSI